MFSRCLDFGSVLVPAGYFAYCLENAFANEGFHIKDSRKMKLRKFFHAVYENSIKLHA